MSKIIVVINQSNKTNRACLDKNDTYAMSYSILNMLEYDTEKNKKYILILPSRCAYTKSYPEIIED